MGTRDGNPLPAGTVTYGGTRPADFRIPRVAPSPSVREPAPAEVARPTPVPPVVHARAPKPPKPRPRPAEQTRARVVELYQAGALRTTIATELGLALSTVTWHLQTAGVQRRVDRHICGEGSKGVSARLADAGLTPAQVRAWAREHFADMPTRGTIPGRVLDAYLDAHEGTA